MTSHLLPLSTLHGAAPGVLDVVFGPDGDFEGAPEWRCPLQSTIGVVYHVEWYREEDTIWCRGERNALVAYGNMALDLRVPSVAARLAGLCARALDDEAVGQAWVTEAGEIHKDFWVLRYCDKDGYAASCAWRKDTGRPDRRSLSPCPTSAPIVPAGLPDVASFLAALTLALAPKIAALGGGR